MLYKNPRKFAIKQASIIWNLAEVLTNNQAKNINKINDEIEKKLKTLTTNFSINKKVVREVGESHPPAEDELSSYCFTDLIPPKVQRLILPLMKMILNLKRWWKWPHQGYC